MPITVPEFNAISRKVITLMGMSGVGKTYLSCVLAKQGWHHYSCDYEIGTKYLSDDIESTLGEKNAVTTEDLSQLSRYVGRLGKGGLSLEEFKRRQKNYYTAECQSLLALKKIVGQAHGEGFTHVINDSTGSLCEIDDDTLLDSVDENSLIVYIQANKEEEKRVLQRAQEYPKPLFFSPERFDYWLDKYLSDHNISSSDEMDSDDFSRWVFPRLFENRLPKYQRIADKYGTTIPSDAFKGVASEDEFLKIIVNHLEGYGIIKFKEFCERSLQTEKYFGEDENGESLCYPWGKPGEAFYLTKKKACIIFTPIILLASCFLLVVSWVIYLDIRYEINEDVLDLAVVAGACIAMSSVFFTGFYLHKTHKPYLEPLNKRPNSRIKNPAIISSFVISIFLLFMTVLEFFEFVRGNGWNYDLLSLLLISVGMCLLTYVLYKLKKTKGYIFNK